MFPFDVKTKDTAPDLPRPGFIPAINYWRALQILKQTPFRELWAAAKKEAPGMLAVFVFVSACLLSLVFTVCWLFVTTVKLIYRTIAGLFSWTRKK
jgi:hypothetical protein